ncbi:SusC/RagA family TonB-linked outer membrane protein [Hymenobacter sp. BT730]|uniref:SusC/RagA family TonB-linked outer membrane protein n=1 Tax=Hymenobacter sp. BT730 TaxID=3063332 RepID=UPI0026E0892F|nr:SusC/RagA family TonB-linked outer membrane protein [Hymenobacter sp. BT730]
MTQLLPLISLLFIAPVALAQQADTLTLRPIASPGHIIITNVTQPGTTSGPALMPGTPFQEQLRQVAGVQVTPYSGAPGAPALVRIRGAASLSRNAQPLYVIDGLPVWQHHTRILLNPNQGTLSNSYELNPTLTLAPDDILSLEVLKGAYETAEYGTQGQNGVIRITTRSGQVGQPRLTYNGYGGIQQARFRYDLLNAHEYAGLVNAADSFYGQEPTYTPEQIEAFGQGTDWQRELLRTAAVHHQQVALQGGNGHTIYYTSAAYGQQQGIVQNSHLRTFNLRATAEHQFTPKLMLRGSLSASEQQACLPEDNLAANMVLAVPTQPARTSTGELAEPEFLFDNPLRDALLTYRTPRQRYLLGQLHLRYSVMPFLTLEMRGSEERINQKMNGYQTPRYSRPGGRVLAQEAEFRQWTFLPSVRFHRTFAQHQVQVGLAAQRQSQQQDQNQNQYSGDQLESFYSSRMPYRLTAYHLTGSYQWKERYEANLRLRRDAALISFGSNKVQYLPAAQVKWHVGREAWLRQFPLLSTLEAWAGWGHTSNTGQFATGAYLMQAVPGAGGFSYRYLSLNELTQQQEVGLTVGLWQDRFIFSTTAYHRNTRVLGRPEIVFPNQPTPPTPTYGHLRNQGLELSATGQWQVGRLQGSTSLVAAFNQNRFQADKLNNYRSNQNQQIVDGQPLATFYTLRYTGLDANGQPSYQDMNQDGHFNIYEDGQARGRGLPGQLLSMGQTLEAGRFRMQAQLDGMFGYQQETSYLRFLNSANTYTNSTRNTLNYWTPENPTATVPGLGAVPKADSDFTLQSGNHVRLTSLTVHYKLWEKDSRNFSLWASGHNLLVLSKYRGFDPNVSSAGADSQQAGLDNGAYPTARTLLIGVQATL